MFRKKTKQTAYEKWNRTLFIHEIANPYAISDTLRKIETVSALRKYEEKIELQYKLGNLTEEQFVELIKRTKLIIAIGEADLNKEAVREACEDKEFFDKYYPAKPQKPVALNNQKIYANGKMITI